MHDKIFMMIRLLVRLGGDSLGFPFFFCFFGAYSRSPLYLFRLRCAPPKKDAAAIGAGVLQTAENPYL
ncbi:MAG: hypothetical protein CFE23_13520 [Flavobacterium sp. BFFFF1]|nr:MAG: hypothetical protein CFE23_13520 [Flavobacterium sp. BFFFF1]